MLRSLVAPLYLIVSVVFSYLAALGVATLVFIDIGGDGGLTFILPFLMFIFLLALGEDYNILVMTRIREEAQTLPAARGGRARGRPHGLDGHLRGPRARRHVRRARGRRRARAPRQPGARRSASASPIGILMDTFLVRTLLVPATVSLLGRWNWWPSRLGRR